ncbi:13267_t:CDS:1, partial [Ambispora leptoticha]
MGKFEENPVIRKLIRKLSHKQKNQIYSTLEYAHIQFDSIVTFKDILRDIVEE